MDMWIPGDRLGMERFSVSTDKQQTFSMVTREHISGRAEKNGFTKSLVEAGSNISTVALRVVKGDENESSA
jgi:hypothetical protein